VQPIPALLVTTSLVIALQINNANANRKSRTAQNKLLTKLVVDLDNDIARFDEIDSIYNDDLQQIEYVFEESLSGKNMVLTSNEQLVPGRGSALYLSITKTSIEEMLNTGLFYQISSDELKDKITKYYELADFLIEKENRDNQNLNDWKLGIKEFDIKFIVMRLREQKNLEHIDWSWLQDPNSGLYIDHETGVIWLKAAIESNQGVMQQIKMAAYDLQRAISEYLDSSVN